MTPTDPMQGNVKYDVPIEVSQDNYNKIVRNYSGRIAHRTEDGKYFIKVWDMSCAREISRLVKLHYSKA